MHLGMMVSEKSHVYPSEIYLFSRHAYRTCFIISQFGNLILHTQQQQSCFILGGGNVVTYDTIHYNHMNCMHSLQLLEKQSYVIIVPIFTLLRYYYDFCQARISEHSCRRPIPSMQGSRKNR